MTAKAQITLSFELDIVEATSVHVLKVNARHLNVASRAKELMNKIDIPELYQLYLAGQARLVDGRYLLGTEVE